MMVDLKALKSTLVVTTGDNYVGAAEPQLREDMGDLFSTVASYYGRPSPSQLDNLKLIESRMDEAKKKYADLRSKHESKYTSALNKAGLTGPVLKSKEDFLKKD
jgi:hypothetical protein